ncbi:hypothetical protein R1sor_002649 [Riccia sorocarpa]|uniref:Uncharacterized protein n=1 Tax=Riccia sorocarpa TaxID=122646 RepID=A0ABD3H209_9MARC
MWDNFQFSALADRGQFPHLLEAIGKKRDSTRRLSVFRRSVEDPENDKRRCNSDPTPGSSKEGEQDTESTMDKGNVASSTEKSSGDTGIQAPSQDEGNEGEENFIPRDPQEQRALLDALNANNEMIHKIIMRQSQDGSMQSRLSTGHRSPDADLQRGRSFTQNPQDEESRGSRTEAEILMAAAKRQQGEMLNQHQWSNTFNNPSYKERSIVNEDSPLEAPQLPPGSPSSSVPAPERHKGLPTPLEWKSKPPENPRIVHSTAAVVQQLASQEQELHSTASVRHQMESPRPIGQQGRTEEATGKELPMENSPEPSGRPTKTYAQATDPTSGNHPTNKANQPSWSSVESREYVRGAMKQMPQPEVKADPSKVKKKILNEEAIERVPKKLHNLETSAMEIRRGAGRYGAGPSRRARNGNRFMPLAGDTDDESNGEETSGKRDVDHNTVRIDSDSEVDSWADHSEKEEGKTKKEEAKEGSSEGEKDGVQTSPAETNDTIEENQAKTDNQQNNQGAGRDDGNEGEPEKEELNSPNTEERLMHEDLPERKFWGDEAMEEDTETVQDSQPSNENQNNGSTSSSRKAKGRKAKGASQSGKKPQGLQTTPVIGKGKVTQKK